MVGYWIPGYLTGNSLTPTQREQGTRYTGGISGGGIGLLGGSETHSPPPTIPDPFTLQALGHSQKHTGQLPRFDLHLALLAHESPSG